jgi:hypothetical protein
MVAHGTHEEDSRPDSCPACCRRDLLAVADDREERDPAAALVLLRARGDGARGDRHAPRPPVQFTEKIGRRRRRIFYVSFADTQEETSLYDEPGWYVETVNPPIEWINPAAFGPYKTLDELYDDACEAYACEEE